MQQVRDTKAGQSISAYIVLDRRNQQVATVHVYHGSTTRVDVFADGDSALNRNCDAMGVTRPADTPREPWVPGRPDPDWYAAIQQQGRASGGGYDMETAAMAGLYIDGRRLFDHCGHDASLDRLYKRYRREMTKTGGPATRAVQERFDRLAKKRGARFANPQTVDTTNGKTVRTVELSLFDESALEARGYGKNDRFGRAYGLTPNEFVLIDKSHADRFCVRIYDSLFYDSGLSRLEALGYRVIRAI